MELINSVKTDSGTPAVWKHQHILDVNDFSTDEYNLVFTTADAMAEVLSREIKRVPGLRGKTVVTLFYEPSTRTKMSFEIAAKNLSADVINLTPSASSAVKGESLVDSIRTLQSLGADVLIMRHQQSGAPYLAAQQLRAHVFNAGDGWHAHPTQALLDAYTIRNHFRKIKDLKVVIVGDILHSRVARSNIWSLTGLGADITLCGPPTLLPLEWSNEKQVSERPGNSFSLPRVRVENNIERAIAGADVVMALRLQKERQQSGLLPSLREYIQLYQVDARRLSLASPNVILMHPGPVNEGIEITPEVARGPRSVIEKQVANGVAVRMALLYLLCGGAG